MSTLSDEWSGAIAYAYEPLTAPDAVRVVALAPSELFGSDLRCEIIQYSCIEELGSLDASRHYSTVSYT